MEIIYQIKIKEKTKHSNCFSTWFLDLIATDDGLFSVRLYSIKKSKKSYGCSYGNITTTHHKVNTKGERMELGWTHTFSNQGEAESHWNAVVSDYHAKSCIIINVRQHKIWE